MTTGPHLPILFYTWKSEHTGATNQRLVTLVVFNRRILGFLAGALNKRTKICRVARRMCIIMIALRLHFANLIYTFGYDAFSLITTI